MRNLSIKARLYFVVIVVCVVLIIFAFYFFNAFDQINRSFTEFEEKNNEFKSAQQTLFESKELTDTVKRYILTRDSKWERNHKKKVNDFEEELTKLKVLFWDHENKTLIDQIQNARDNLTGTELLIMAKVRAGETSQAALLFDQKYENRTLKLEKIIGIIVDDSKTKTHALLNQNKSSISNAQKVVFFSVFFLSIFVTLIIGITTLAISRQIGSLVKTSRAIAGGDLTRRAEVKSKNEIGQLATSFNFMLDKLSAEEGMRQQIIDVLPDSLFLIDESGNIERVNPSAEKLLGYDQQELVGKSESSIFNTIELDQLTEGDSMRSKISSIRSKNGSEVPIMLYGKILLTKDGKKRKVLVAVDRKKEKEYAKERLSSFFPILQKIAIGDFSMKLPVGDIEDEFSDFSIALNLIIEDIGESSEKEKVLNQDLKSRNKEMELKALVLNDTKNSLKETLDMIEKDKLKIGEKDKELKTRINELERMNKLMIGREVKMKELKEKLKANNLS
jgi:PAS domain S-box-containing protein